MIAPPSNLRTDDQIVSYFAQASRPIGERHPFVMQDYPLTLSVVMTPGVIRRIVTDNPSCVMLKHEDWPGLEKISRCAASRRTARCAISILTGNGGLFLDFEMERGADGAMTGYAFPDMLVDVVGCRRPASATRRTTCSTRICRWCATSSSRASASRCANKHRAGRTGRCSGIARMWSSPAAASPASSRPSICWRKARACCFSTATRRRISAAWPKRVSAEFCLSIRRCNAGRA
jgi:hypothetical protein